ncbi:hypothetical protein RUM43_009739, partial [Polyplax serrata]
ETQWRGQFLNWIRQDVVQIGDNKEDIKENRTPLDSRISVVHGKNHWLSLRST